MFNRISMWSVEVYIKGYCMDDGIDYLEGIHYFLFKRSAEKFIKTVNSSHDYYATNLSCEPLWLNGRIDELPENPIISERKV